MSFADWSQFVFTAVAGAFGLFCLFDGTRRIGAYGMNPQTRQLVGVGVAIVAMLAGFAYSKHWIMRDAMRAYQPPAQVRELPDDYGRKMTPSRKEASSQALARGTFINSGTVGQHFDIAGKKKLYAPTQAEIRQREAVVAAATRLEHDAREAFAEFVLWLVWGLSAVFFGLCFAREPAAKPAEEVATETEKP